MCLYGYRYIHIYIMFLFNVFVMLQSPFERFSAHYVHEYPEKVYERTLHLISEEMDKMKMR